MRTHTQIHTHTHTNTSFAYIIQVALTSHAHGGLPGSGSYTTYGAAVTEVEVDALSGSCLLTYQVSIYNFSTKR